MALHKIQQIILKIAEEKDIAKMSLNDISQEVKKMDESIKKSYPQLIKFHMDQLQNRGLLNINRSKGIIEKNVPGWAKGIIGGVKAKIYNIPIYGMANCGSGGIIAEQNLEGFIPVSNTLLGKKPKDSFFAIIASGKSMNKASLSGKNIESGDYLIVDKTAPVDSGDIVVAILEDQGLVKKIIKDQKNHQILLVSESTEQYPPIVLHTSDQFFINGKVTEIIKKPK